MGPTLTIGALTLFRKRPCWLQRINEPGLRIADTMTLRHALSYGLSFRGSPSRKPSPACSATSRSNGRRCAEYPIRSAKARWVQKNQPGYLNTSSSQALQTEDAVASCQIIEMRSGSAIREPMSTPPHLQPRHPAFIDQFHMPSYAFRILERRAPVFSR